MRCEVTLANHERLRHHHNADVTYDRIIITGGASTDYTGEAGVFRFDTAYGLNQTMARRCLGSLSGVTVFWTRQDKD